MGRMYKSKKPLTVIAKKPPTRVQRIAKDVAMLKRNQKKSEFKWQDTPVSLSINPNTSGLQGVDNIVNGISPNDYIGAEYTVKSVQLDLALGIDSVTSANDGFIRVSLIRYKSMNGNNPSYGPAGGSDGVYQFDNVYSPRNMDNRNDFIIMKEWDLTYDVSNKVVYRLKYYKKLNLVTVKDQPSGFTEQNGYFLFAYYKTINGAATLPVNITGNCRIRFTDN